MIATVYAAAMLFAGGPKFIMLSALLYAPGTLLFVIARREQGKPLFTRVEWLLVGVVFAVAIGALYALASGDISI
jgi:arginine:ornithine antiporter/lysine permease